MCRRQLVSGGRQKLTMSFYHQMHLKADEQKSSRELVANDMKEQLNNDERLTNHMVPGFALGCRRMTPGSGYLQSLTKSNVEVLTQAVTRVTEQGIVDSSGIEHEVDIIVFATGFDTSFTPHFKCIGRDGRVLKEEFGDFPKAYMSIMAEGFPNLFRKQPYFLLSTNPDFQLTCSSLPWTKQPSQPQFSPPNRRLAFPLHVRHDHQASRREHQMLRSKEGSRPGSLQPHARANEAPRLVLSMQIMVQEREAGRTGDRNLSRQQITLLRNDEESQV